MPGSIVKESVKIYKKQWETRIDAPLDEVWEFFSRPENLNRLTAGEMKFEILSDVEGVKMYPGMLVEYRVNPFGNMSFNWVTEITEISEKKYFIDEQRAGPYRMWHHEHHFEQTDAGVLMTDLLYYALPFGFLGRIANGLLVSNKIDRIFAYRKDKIGELF